MEVDDWILKKLFGPQKAEKKLTDSELNAFLQELCHLGAEQLGNEPGRLSDEKFSLQEETENLAFSNYKTFIQAANCSKDIYDDFTLIDKHLSSVMSRLPDLGAESRSFLQEAQKISSRRAANTLALNKHTQLLEILEIPQVMDTCVRAGYWEEALELVQYVSKLQRRLAHIPIIQKIAEEVESERQQLLEQLVEQLHSQLSLPQCLKVVGFLRRLSLFTEAELRIKFLMCRDEWLRGVLAGIPSDDPYQHVTKVMEQTRVHLFDIVTQYRAVFADDDPVSVSVAPFSSQLAFSRSLAVREEFPTNLAGIFYSWISQKVQEFLDVVDMDLRRGVGGRLDSVLAQCMYFGLSFGRVGADFRSLALPLFEDASFREFNHCLSVGTSRMLNEMNLDGFLENESGVGGMGSALLPGAESGSLSPPSTLMEWPALCLFTNSLLMGFNSIRLCLPLSLAPRVVSGLQESLRHLADAMAVWAETNWETWSEGKRDRFGLACRLVSLDLFPFLNRCLRILFPPESVAELLGVGVLELEKTPGLCQMSSQVHSRLEAYLPAPAAPQLNGWTFEKQTEEEEEEAIDLQSSAPEPEFPEPVTTGELE